MKHLTKKTLSLFAFLLIFSFPSFASHIVGGDLTVKWINGNNFEVTLQFFRDASSATPFDAQIRMGLYNKSTNAWLGNIVLSNPDSSFLNLGDACYKPSLSILKAVYKAAVTIPTNPDGYYLSYVRCCRNATITNITTPDAAGYVMYCEIPDPSIHNSTPTFNSIPDGYMCRGYLNQDDFSCTDADGDQLVYSFSTPLSCSSNNLCSQATPGPIPSAMTPLAGPYGQCH